MASRIALVTGCGRALGIGGAAARALAASGHTVVVADVAQRGVADASQESGTALGGLDALVAELRGRPGEAAAVIGDVSSPTDTSRMVEEVVDRYGRLDVLVNAAGAPQGEEFADVADVSLEAWERVLAINLTGAFLVTQAAVPAMRSNGWGRIVHVSSLAGRTGYARQAAYSASKAGLLGLTRSVALDVARDGITVNAVCPGWIRTSRTYNSARRVDEDVERELARREARVPVGRLGAAEDVAATIAFLTSEAAGYVTGQTFIVDGGLHPV
jgi:3-oxoacyl-[acyl-carrier protein] reductase